MNRININIEDLFNLETAVIYNPDQFKSASYVSINSKDVKNNSIFVAIKGERLDGHKYVRDAVENGAATVVINRSKLKNFESLDVTIVTVKDTSKAYGELANAWRNKFKGTVIGLTGSSGKTSTKEMIATLLSEKFSTNKSIANNNNHIGVPLTILATKADDGAMVLEHGTNHFGEIEYTANISKPDISLITNIGSSHLEFLIDADGVFKEKIALLDHTDAEDGIVLVNTDDPYLKDLTKKYNRTISYGFKGRPDIKGKVTGYSDLGFPEVEVKYKNKTICVTIPLMGSANAKNYLAACSVALVMGLNKKEILKGTENFLPTKGRLEFNENKQFMYINDAYNSNPDSTKAAIEVLKKLKRYKRKVVLLGDMLELGKRRVELHEGLVEHFKGSRSLEIFTYGPLMKKLNVKLNKAGISAKHFSRRDSLAKFLRDMDLTDKVMLIKGSRGMGMDEFVNIIKERS